MGYDFVSSTGMAHGPKRHLKAVTAPKHWMLEQLTSVFGPRPPPGPHKLRQCPPLSLSKEQT